MFIFYELFVVVARSSSGCAIFSKNLLVRISRPKLGKIWIFVMFGSRNNESANPRCADLRRLDEVLGPYLLNYLNLNYT